MVVNPDAVCAQHTNNFPIYMIDIENVRHKHTQQSARRAFRKAHRAQLRARTQCAYVLYFFVPNLSLFLNARN